MLLASFLSLLLNTLAMGAKTQGGCRDISRISHGWSGTNSFSIYVNLHGASLDTTFVGSQPLLERRLTRELCSNILEP